MYTHIRHPLSGDRNGATPVGQRDDQQQIDPTGFAAIHHHPNLLSDLRLAVVQPLPGNRFYQSRTAVAGLATNGSSGGLH